MGIVNGAVYLDHLIQRYNIQNYVETGTGNGSSMRKTLPFDLARYGIELDEHMCGKLQEEFITTRLQMFCGYSHELIDDVIEELDDEPTLFFLDAHFPDSDYKHIPYDSEPNMSKRLPLKDELIAITEARNTKYDVFILDDVRIYENVPGIEQWEHKELVGAENLDFAREALRDTHNIYISPIHQGYFIATPKYDNIKGIIR